MYQPNEDIRKRKENINNNVEQIVLNVGYLANKFH